MIIKKPMQNCKVSQYFGANKACISPVTRKVVGKKGLYCPAGYKDFYQSIGMKGHNGLDLSCPRGERIYHSIITDSPTWTAKYSGDFDGGLGLDLYNDTPIVLEEFSKIAGPEALAYYDRDDKDWYNNQRDTAFVFVKFRYWHLKDYSVHDGQKVSLGDELAKADSTGASSNDHLHWGFKIVDEEGRSLDTGNGYYGAVDFIPKYNHEFILNYLKKKAPSKSLADHLNYVAWLFVGTNIEKIFESLADKQ
jgi:hypothetical protein